MYVSSKDDCQGSEKKFITFKIFFKIKCMEFHFIIRFFFIASMVKSLKTLQKFCTKSIRNKKIWFQNKYTFSKRYALKKHKNFPLQKCFICVFSCTGPKINANALDQNLLVLQPYNTQKECIITCTLHFKRIEKML